MRKVNIIIIPMVYYVLGCLHGCYVYVDGVVQGCLEKRLDLPSVNGGWFEINQLLLQMIQH